MHIIAYDKVLYKTVTIREHDNNTIQYDRKGAQGKCDVTSSTTSSLMSRCFTKILPI